MPWDESGDVLQWLLGLTGADFWATTFGKQWHHWSARAPCPLFSTVEFLRLLQDFDPAPERLLHTRRMQEYGFERTPVLDPARADGALRFWSAVMCRRSHGVYQDVSDEAQIAAFLAHRELRTAEDLANRGENWTFVLNQVHGANPMMRSLHSALWTALGISGGVNSYLTPPFAAGKAPHVDEHDVFVVQQEGVKKWFLLADDMRTPKEEVVLQPGDVLYLPRGIPHRACSVSAEPSLHLAVGVTRGALCGAGLLAACLEVRGAGRMGRETAQRVEAAQRVLEGCGGPWGPLSQLPMPAVLRCLLRALDPADLPDDVCAGDLAQALLALAREALPQLRQAGAAPGAEAVAAGLEELLTLPAAKATDRIQTSFWVLREHLWEEHYMIHLPAPLHDPVPASSWPRNQRFRRPPDSSAVLAGDGSLLLNGYRILSLGKECLEGVRHCLGLYTGAAGMSFAFDSLPGLGEAATEVVHLLLRYRGLVVEREPPSPALTVDYEAVD